MWACATLRNPEAGTTARTPPEGHGTLPVGRDADQQVRPPQIILDAVDKPRVISFKGAADLVTETDKRSEEAIIKVLSKLFLLQLCFHMPRLWLAKHLPNDRNSGLREMISDKVKAPKDVTVEHITSFMCLA